MLLPGAEAQIGYKAAADAEQKKTLLLKDFHPKSMLHVKQTPVEENESGAKGLLTGSVSSFSL